MLVAKALNKICCPVFNVYPEIETDFSQPLTKNDKNKRIERSAANIGKNVNTNCNIFQRAASSKASGAPKHSHQKWRRKATISVHAVITIWPKFSLAALISGEGKSLAFWLQYLLEWAKVTQEGFCNLLPSSVARGNIRIRSGYFHHM